MLQSLLFVHIPVILSVVEMNNLSSLALETISDGNFKLLVQRIRVLKHIWLYKPWKACCFIKLLKKANQIWVGYLWGVLHYMELDNDGAEIRDKQIVKLILQKWHQPFTIRTSTKNETKHKFTKIFED